MGMIWQKNNNPPFLGGGGEWGLWLPLKLNCMQPEEITKMRRQYLVTEGFMSFTEHIVKTPIKIVG